MAGTDHERLADRLARESEELERRARSLKREIDDTRSDWERKRADPKVPGAQPPDQPAGDGPAGEQRPPSA
jgi:hypothetical protein